MLLSAIVVFKHMLKKFVVDVELVTLTSFTLSVAVRRLPETVNVRSCPAPYGAAVGVVTDHCVGPTPPTLNTNPPPALGTAVKRLWSNTIKHTKYEPTCSITAVTDATVVFPANATEVLNKTVPVGLVLLVVAREPMERHAALKSTTESAETITAVFGVDCLKMTSEAVNVRLKVAPGPTSEGAVYESGSARLMNTGVGSDATL